jgi:uncharacterized Fe-S cluster-containing radical SAM superfamily protein
VAARVAVGRESEARVAVVRARGRALEGFQRPGQVAARLDEIAARDLGRVGGGDPDRGRESLDVALELKRRLFADETAPTSAD